MVMMILLKSNNYIESREYLEGLIKDYKIFDSIPSQHARETDTLKFKYSDEKKAVELTNLNNRLSGLKRKASIMKIKKILL